MLFRSYILYIIYYYYIVTICDGAGRSRRASRHSLIICIVKLLSIGFFMKIVYRVEKECGQGPYRAFTKINRTHSIMSTHLCWDDPFHPAPYEIDPEEYCGFSSMCQLRQWFYGCLDWLYSRGFKIVRYEVPSYRVPDPYQILFCKYEAKKIKSTL